VILQGSYADTSLKKQLKAKSFEMSVLNAVNISCMERLIEQNDQNNNKYKENITSKLNTIRYERVNNYYKKTKSYRNKLIDIDLDNDNENTDNDNSEISVLKINQDTNSTRDDKSDDLNISNYFEEYNQNKQINDLNDLNNQQKTASTFSVDHNGKNNDDDSDNGKKPKSKRIC
jgi:hypothetical protein